MNDEPNPSVPPNTNGEQFEAWLFEQLKQGYKDPADCNIAAIINDNGEMVVARRDVLEKLFPDKPLIL